MKSIRTKFTLALVICTLFAVLTCGGISIYQASIITLDCSSREMQLTLENQSQKLEATLNQIPQSVDILANISLNNIKDVERFKSDKSYVAKVTNKLKPFFSTFAQQTSGAMTAYIRFNPEFTEPTSGIFLTKDPADNTFSFVEPTDFSKYDPSDAEHVGWYYEPVKYGKPMWMNPYMNSNLNIYMISYVVPIFVNGESIGIVGMDIDFSAFSDVIDHTTVFKNGYAFLINNDKNIIYHKSFDIGTSLSEISSKLYDNLDKMSRNDEMLTFKYNGIKNVAYSKLLDNGMYIILIATEADLQSSTLKMDNFIFANSLAILVITTLIGVIIGTRIVQPIKKLEDIIINTSNFDFERSKYANKLLAGKDETGQMARAVHILRDNLRKMSSDIMEAQASLTTTMNKLASSTSQLSQMSEDNSATTQQLSAAMEETSASMESVDNTIETIVERSNHIMHECKNGKSMAGEIKGRADSLKEYTILGSNRTKEMYEDLQQRTNNAIEKSHMVNQISQLANVILDISDQTNLLALNASIEAARAGEAGKGFQVVASEIGHLATQTSSATESIKNMITEVNEIVDNMKVCLTDSSDFLKTNVLTDYENFLNTSEHYAQDASCFEENMISIDEAISSLSSAIHEIKETINVVNATVDEATNGIGDIAEKAQESSSLANNNRNLVLTSHIQLEKLEEILNMLNQNKK